MGISLIFGRALSRKLLTERQKAGLGARRHTTSSCKNGLIRWQYACDFFSPAFGRGWGRLLLIVNLIHIRFAFACNFLYICIGESLKRLSPFLLCGVEKETIWLEQAFSMADIILQYALFCSVKWLTLRGKMSGFGL